MNDLMVPENESNVSIDVVNNKLLTLNELIDIFNKETDPTNLPDDVRRFKLYLIKKSMIDITTLIQAQELIQNELVNKIREDISIYPITTIADILGDINSLVDRNLKIMESILPKMDNLSDYLKASANQVNIIQTINIKDQSPTSLDKISQVVEEVITKINAMN